MNEINGFIQTFYKKQIGLKFFVYFVFQFWKEKRQHVLVVMSACSNVTGILTDTDTVAVLAHTHGALAVFDYASGGNL